MARSAASRGKRAKPDARGEQQRPRRGAKVEEPQLFFTRIRARAKWMFVFLILAFAGGFVLYGVGTGYGGLEDLLSFNQGSGASISKLQKQVAENPTNADALRKLASALRAKERHEEAIDPLERYTQLRPKDAGALQELAGLYLQRARTYYEELNLINYQLASIPGGGFAISPTSFLAKELQKDPFYKAISADLTRRQSEVAAKFNAALSSRADAYRRAVAALPADDTSLPGTVFAWARAAEEASDFETALKAYQRYLKLAPDSGLANDARTAIKRIKAYLDAQKRSGATAGAG